MYLLPIPQEYSSSSKRFVLRYDTKILLDNALTSKEFYYAQILQGQILDSLGFIPAVSKSYHKEDNSIILSLAGEQKPEEYHLVIETQQVNLTGGSSRSLLYAVQTLRQIIISQGAVLDGIEIIDYPKILNRGFYCDAARGRIPTLETLKRLADKMSFYKLNQLQLYMEHSYLLKGFSEIWRDDTPITAEEILSLDCYCRKLNIELVPSIASFGHLHKILTSKTYSELCEMEASEQEPFSYVRRMQHHTVDVSNEKSFVMIKNILSQFLPLFSSEKFNICADETFDLGKGKSEKLAQEIGKDRMYTKFLRKICDYIKAYGKEPMFWGDILVTNPGTLEDLPENAVCLNWDYNTKIESNNIEKLYELGVRQYVCPGVHGWKHLINNLENAYDNILAMSRYAWIYHAEGLLITDWGDYGHINHPEFSTAGMIYGAAFSWNAKPLGFDELNRQISAIEYLDSSKSFLAIVNRMAEQDNALWEHLVEYKEWCQNRLEKIAYREFFHDMDIDRIKKSKAELTEAVDEMYRIIPLMAADQRSRVKAYLVAARGIGLFLSLSEAIVQYRYQRKIICMEHPKELAEKLEYWFQDYKEIWRLQYKESELYRIQEVIFWYTDLLREIEE